MLLLWVRARWMEFSKTFLICDLIPHTLGITTYSRLFAGGTELSEGLLFDTFTVFKNSVDDLDAIAVVAGDSAGDVEIEKGSDQFPLPCFIGPKFEVVPAQNYSSSSTCWPRAALAAVTIFS